MQTNRPGPSAGAQCLVYWAEVSRDDRNDAADRECCADFAREWAAAMIAGEECPAPLTIVAVAPDEAHGDSGVA